MDGESQRADRGLLAVFVVLAAWAAFVSGLVEGAVLALAHRFPVILASKKAPPDAIWIAPALDILLFSAVAIVLATALRVLRLRHEERALRAAVWLFTFLGVYGVVAAPGIIHRVSALLLAAGVGALAASRLGGRARELSARLRAYMLVIPATLLVLAAALPLYSAVRERVIVRDLPAAGARPRNVLVLILDTVRRDGYCVVDQELEVGLISISVPVFNVTGETIAAVNIASSTARIGAGQMADRFLPPLLEIQRDLRPLIRQ